MYTVKYIFSTFLFILQTYASTVLLEKPSSLGLIYNTKTKSPAFLKHQAPQENLEAVLFALNRLSELSLGCLSINQQCIGGHIQ
jgi:hypothetical protein